MGASQKHTLGKNGEQLARQFLRDKGYTIIAGNYRAGHGEIDIIARTDDVLAFVEVKSYYAKPLVLPELRVTKKQQKSIIRTAYAFLETHQEFDDYDVRYDIIVVNFSRYPAEIVHYEGAFWQDGAFPF